MISNVLLPDILNCMILVINVKDADKLNKYNIPHTSAMRNQLYEADWANQIKARAEDAFFRYSGREKYIQISEYNRVGLEEECIKMCLIDEQLSIITTKFEEIQELHRLQLKHPIEEKDTEVRYSIKEDKREVLLTLKYTLYNSNDFTIGRLHFGRNYNTFKIGCDAISRFHCNITHSGKRIENKFTEKVHSLAQTIADKARPSSNWRRLPSSLVRLICQYAEEQCVYTIRDCESRHGTYVQDLLKYSIRMQEDFAYEFDREEYCIRIISLISSRQDQTVSQHNQRLIEMIGVFCQEDAMNLYEKCQKLIYSKHLPTLSGAKMLSLPEIEALLKKEGREKIVGSWMIVDYGCSKQYYFLLCTHRRNCEFTIGHQQDLQINPSVYDYQFTYHGKILYKDDRWLIEPGDLDSRVWVKIPKNVEFNLQPKSRYKIRLGQKNCLSLDFYNFT